MDESAGEDLGYTNGYIEGEDGEHYYFASVNRPGGDNQKFLRDADKRLFNNNSKIVFTIAINPAYYSKTHLYNATAAMAHEAFVHLRSWIDAVKALRTVGAASFMNVAQNVDGLKEHALAYLGYNQTFIRFANEYGNRLRKLNPDNATEFKKRFIKTGIDYYRDDINYYKRYRPNAESLPPRRNPSSYLKF